MFGGEKWKTQTFLTAVLCPGYVSDTYVYVKVSCSLRVSGVFIKQAVMFTNQMNAEVMQLTSNHRGSASQQS